ncbi:GntR family transcriptional regulator [Cupriavidus basilensis]
MTDTLRQRIVGGVYRQGDRLVEHALSAELGVSRVPVREALRAWRPKGWSASSQPPRRLGGVPVGACRQGNGRSARHPGGLNARLAAQRDLAAGRRVAGGPAPRVSAAAREDEAERRLALSVPTPRHEVPATSPSPPPAVLPRHEDSALARQRTGLVFAPAHRPRAPCANPPGRGTRKILKAETAGDADHRSIAAGHAASLYSAAEAAAPRRRLRQPLSGAAALAAMACGSRMLKMPRSTSRITPLTKKAGVPRHALAIQRSAGARAHAGRW